MITSGYVKKFLDCFSVFGWLWNHKPDEALKVFNKSEPGLEEFEEKLKEFDSHITTVNTIEHNHQIGALSLKTENVKASLKSYI